MFWKYINIRLNKKKKKDYRLTITTVTYFFPTYIILNIIFYIMEQVRRHVKIIHKSNLKKKNAIICIVL